MMNDTFSAPSTSEEETIVMKNVTKQFTNKEILDAYERAGESSLGAAKLLGCSDRSLRHWIKRIKDAQGWGEELHEDFIRVSRQKQGAADRARISEKKARETFRQINALEAYIQQLQSTLTKFGLHKATKKHKVGKNGAVGVIHLSDIHFNELVELEHNKYDFQIAAKRICLHIDRATAHFKSLGISNVLFAFTGDLLNSDRRLDELLSMAYNRALATHLAIDILQQAILHANKNFNVTVAWINGNEGRIDKEIGNVDPMATNNFDEIIMRGLQHSFAGSEGVTFVESGSLETVVNVAGQNLLLVHGHNLTKNYSRSINDLKSKYASRGVIIHYVIFGHIHEAYISDIFARSGSPVGDNAYSDRALNLCGRASQNYYIFYENGTRDGVKVDLQNVDGVDGYTVNTNMFAFNEKSATKAMGEGQTILSIKI